MEKIDVEKSGEGLLLKQKGIDSDENLDQMSGYRFGADVFIAHKNGDTPSFGLTSIDGFLCLVESLVRRNWTGMVLVEVGENARRLFFVSGRLVFAGSNCIDDRLGEVIYRRGLITLDDMMDAAVLVTKEKKFGQVCLEKKTFNHEGLWLALRFQILNVLKMIFSSKELAYSMQEGKLPPTEIALTQRTDSILSQVGAFGTMYRFFDDLLGPQTKILVNEYWFNSELCKEGTFTWDLARICQEKQTFEAVLETSKLTPEATKSELLRMYLEDAFQLEGANKVTLRRDRIHLAPLKSLLDGYSLVASAVKREYENAGIVPPWQEALSVVGKIDSGICPAIYLDRDLQITESSLNFIFSQCYYSKDRTAQIQDNIRRLTQFIVLAAGDALPWESKKAVKAEYSAYF